MNIIEYKLFANGKLSFLVTVDNGEIEKVIDTITIPVLLKDKSVYYIGFDINEF